MRKILTLTGKHFLIGIGDPYDTGAGLWEKAEGIDFMRYPGLLAAGYTPTDLDSGGSVVVDKIKWLLPNPESGNCYGYGDEGKIYQIVMSTDVVSLLQTTANSEGQGAEIFKDYLIYAQDTQVGRYGPLSGTPAFDDDGISGAAQLTDMSDHPIEEGANGKCYVADKDSNGVPRLNSFSLIDGSDWTLNAFTYKVGYTIRAHLNDGRYHVIGMTGYPTGTYGANEVRIVFWNYLHSSTYQQEYIIPEADLFALKRKGNWIYAFTRWAVYKFRFNYFYEDPIITEGSGISNLYCEARQGAVDIWKGHLLWGSYNGWAYGPRKRGRTSFLSNPLRVAAGSHADSEIYALRVINLTKIYVAGGSASTNKLYAFYTGTASATATTAPIDLGRPWDIKALRIVMQTAGSVTASITNMAGTSIVSATITDSDLIQTRGTADPIVSQVIISLSIASAARMKQIDVLADPAPEYHA